MATVDYPLAETRPAGHSSSGAAWTSFALTPADLRVTLPEFRVTGKIAHRLATGSRLPEVDPVKHWDAATRLVASASFRRNAAPGTC